MKNFSQKLEAYIKSQPDENRESIRREVDAVLKSGTTKYKDWLTLVANPLEPDASRIAAFWVIGTIGDRDAFPALGLALKDESPQMRGHAIGALIQLRTRVKKGSFEEVVDQLLRMVQSDTDLNVRIQSAFALREFRDPRTVEPLIVLITNRQEPAQVRDVASEALAYIPDIRSIEPMIEALEDPAEVVRITAAYTLGSLAAAHHQGEFGGSEVSSSLESAVSPLIKALLDPSEKVRYWAASALGDLRDPRAIPELQRVAKFDKGTWYGDDVADAARYAIQVIQEQLLE